MAIQFKERSSITAAEYQALVVSKEKGSKYNNVKVTVNTDLFGKVVFDSKAEYHRYLFHEKMVNAGEYTIERQVRYDLIVNNQKICTYVADFVVKFKDGTYSVEDVKGFETGEYKLKKKLMLACLGIEIVDIKKNTKISQKKTRLQARGKKILDKPVV